jgi:hypothetical protein
VRSLDAYLPSYEFSTRHELSVDAPPELADRAIRTVTYREVPLVRALLFPRGLGLRRAEERVLPNIVPRGQVLEDVPGEGMVVALTGHFWRATGRGRSEAARAVVDFRALPGRLSTETRVRVPDSSRREFERYWRIVRPFSGMIRKDLLRAAKRRAEATR